MAKFHADYTDPQLANTVRVSQIKFRNKIIIEKIHIYVRSKHSVPRLCERNGKYHYYRLTEKLINTSSFLFQETKKFQRYLRL